MELTKGQEEGLKIACERFRSNQPYTVIAGFAGTGKTTLVQFIIDELKLREEHVTYIAYTGRAALILRNKGCLNAMTAHKLLYRSEEKADGTYVHTPRKRLEGNFKLIVCDEASMMPQEMIDLLLSHRVHVLFLGDQAQLPPIEGEQIILQNPHVFLTEITRQALDNPIIKMSMDVREGIPFVYGGDKNCRVIPREKVSDKLLLGADIIIVGKNVTRHKINEYVRQLKWGDKYTENPIEGDRCICLKNKWDEVGTNGDPLINGQLGILQNIRIEDVPPYGTILIADFLSDDGGLYRNLMMDYKLMLTGTPTINADNWKQFANWPKLFEFAYGYAVTCHKSEGSEFNKVLVCDEAFGDADMKKRWRYTAVTRAIKQLIVAI